MCCLQAAHSETVAQLSDLEEVVGEWEQLEEHTREMAQWLEGIRHTVTLTQATPLEQQIQQHVVSAYCSFLFAHIIM